MAQRRIVAPTGRAVAAGATDKKVDLPTLFEELDKATGDGRMDKVKKMLRADRFQLFSEVTDQRVTGVVKSQTDASLFYACSVDDSGGFMCCTQNLNVCGGLRGKPCKHLLVLLVGLAQGGQIEPGVGLRWAKATKGKKPVLDKDSMSATFIKYKGVTCRVGRPIDLSPFFDEDPTKALIDRIAGRIRRIVIKLYDGEDLDKYLTGEKPFDFEADPV